MHVPEYADSQVHAKGSCLEMDQCQTGSWVSTSVLVSAQLCLSSTAIHVCRVQDGGEERRGREGCSVVSGADVGEGQSQDGTYWGFYWGTTKVPLRQWEEWPSLHLLAGDGANWAKLGEKRPGRGQEEARRRPVKPVSGPWVQLLPLK